MELTDVSFSSQAVCAAGAAGRKYECYRQNRALQTYLSLEFFLFYDLALQIYG